jgi:HAD superfamily hydrolase (TIGR01549 family)
MLDKIGNYKLYIFDLDNTIYDEKLYLFPAYRTIANYLEKKKLAKSQRIYTYLTREFKNAGRELLFDKLIQKLGLEQELKTEFLSILRTNRPKRKMPVYPQIAKLFSELQTEKKRIYVITNGNVTQQKNKVENIKWGKFRKSIHLIYANETKPKPSPESFNALRRKININPKECVYIGDAESDRIFAKNSKIEFIHPDQLLSHPSKNKSNKK